MEPGTMELKALIRDKIEKQIASWNAEIESAEAKARARHAEAQAEVADAELEKELWERANDLKEKVKASRKYLGDLADAGEEQAEKIRARFASLFD
jgi:hypothetical protein